MRGLISRIFGFVAAVKFPRVLQTFINEKYVSGFKIDMSEFKQPKEYESLTALFTRELQRPRDFDVSPQVFISPSDGTCLERGVSKELKAISVKGHEYGIAELLGDSMDRSERDAELEYVNIYLSPRDYHRIHMPCAGRLRQMVYVPGDLFSVSPATAAAIPGLFARNERVVCVFDAPWGPWVLVLVGAAIVGSMATVWHGTVNPPRPGHIQRWDYPAHEGGGSAQAAAESADANRKATENAVFLDRGAEMGRFMLGSTVVMLFPAGAPRLTTAWQPGQSVRMGEPMSQA